MLANRVGRTAATGSSADLMRSFPEDAAPKSVSPCRKIRISAATSRFMRGAEKVPLYTVTTQAGALGDKDKAALDMQLTETH
jgi:hypothetical protein